ncbi:MAG TPA: hypothetical protein VLU73_12085 [Methylococcaceae bacterium]|nr:hypothetical protein [Methylococcaceae bacterium]
MRGNQRGQTSGAKQERHRLSRRTGGCPAETGTGRTAQRNPTRRPAPLRPDPRIHWPLHGPSPLETLDETALISILNVPNNAFLRQYQKLFAYENVELHFTPQALSTIARKAIQRDTGARRTPRILEQVLRKPVLEIPCLCGIRHCVVDDFIIDGKAGAN